MNPPTRYLVLAALALAGVAACGSDDSAGAPTDDSTPESETSASETSESSTPAPGSSRLVDIAVQELLARLDLPESESNAIEIVSVEEVTWRDRSLGCPAKDMQYAQVLTPGTRIVLRYDGTTYQYHAGAGRDPFYCARPESPAPG